MGKIHLMDELLSSKIAAGEVVERPASVVKELVENALDASARAIWVAVTEGGARQIRVTDDGTGMDCGDAMLSLKRHATSKITNEEDLLDIKTMGFRGEALSSIASVSKLTLKTRIEGDGAGIKIECAGGGKLKSAPDGSPKGTSVEINELFFNTPARKKFMRTSQTEFSRITDIVKRIAVIHPDIRFKLTHGKSKTIDSPSGSFATRVNDLFGSSVFKELIEVKERTGGGYSVTGFISRPTLSYATQKGLYLYVNKRPVRDPGLARAITIGYSGLLERGRFPLIILNIEMPPSEVDVNVHPTKSEVRFKTPSQLFDLVKGAVSKALSGSLVSPPGGGEGGGGHRSYGTTDETSDKTNRYSTETTTPFVAKEGGARIEGRAKKSAPLGLSFETKDVVSPEFLQMEVVGQLWGEYLVTESFEAGGEFYIIDQHGASERVRFERLKKDFYSNAVPSQLLLIPERIETTLEEAEALRATLPTLTSMGFEITPFSKSAKKGGETFMIKAAPELLGGRAVKGLILDLASELEETGLSRILEERVEGVLMTLACHSVIRGKKILTKEEGRALLTEMSKIDFAAHCPHGRLVVKEYKRTEIEALFGRR